MHTLHNHKCKFQSWHYVISKQCSPGETWAWWGGPFGLWNCRSKTVLHSQNCIFGPIEWGLQSVIPSPSEHCLGGIPRNKQTKTNKEINYVDGQKKKNSGYIPWLSSGRKISLDGWVFNSILGQIVSTQWDLRDRVMSRYLDSPLPLVTWSLSGLASIETPKSWLENQRVYW